MAAMIMLGTLGLLAAIALAPLMLPGAVVAFVAVAAGNAVLRRVSVRGGSGSA